jgi:hypothetical protein
MGIVVIHYEAAIYYYSGLTMTFKFGSLLTITTSLPQFDPDLTGAGHATRMAEL